MTKKNLILLFLSTGITFLNSCGPDIDELKKQSDGVYSAAISYISYNDKTINIDSINIIYHDLQNKDVNLAFDYAYKLNDLVKLTEQKVKKTNDSVTKIKTESLVKNIETELKEWSKTKAGKIQAKYPNWTKEECEKLAQHKIWLGMSLDMLKFLRGNPNQANPSNYGNGVNWQWCWDNYTPSCFYGSDDGIVTSYN